MSMPVVSPSLKLPLLVPPLMSTPVFLLALLVSVATAASVAGLSVAVVVFPLLLQLQNHRTRLLKKSTRLIILIFVEESGLSQHLLQVCSQPFFFYIM
jgi:hypothetical protein